MNRVASLVLLAALASGQAFAGYTLSEQQIHATGSQPDVAGIGDIDGDGRNDVVVVTNFDFDDENDYHLFVFFQKPDGSLSVPAKYATPGAGRNGLAMADLDRDGRTEIIVGHGTGITIVDYGMVKGRATMTSRSWTHPEFDPAAEGVAVLDVNRDGKLDIVGQSWGGGGVVYIGTGDGRIARTRKLATTVYGNIDIEAGDFNGDGFDDLVVFSGNMQEVNVLYNDGTDDLAPPLSMDPHGEEFAILGVAGAGDFDDDGREDLVLKTGRRSLGLYRQGPNGAFLSPRSIDTYGGDAYGDPSAIVGHDLDLDGRDDMIVGHGTDVIGLYMQDEDGLAPETLVTAGASNAFQPHALAAGDINGDTCTDIALADEYYKGLVVLYGSGCNPIADLGVSVGVTNTVVALRLDNVGAAAAAAPEARIDLSVVNGTLAVGELPAGCSKQATSTRTTRVTCTGDTIDAGTSRTLLLPIALAGGDFRNVLNVVASATTSTIEQNLRNNAASKSLRIGAIALKR